MRAGLHTGGVPNGVFTMNGRVAMGVSVVMSIDELRSGLGVGGAGASTGTSTETGELFCVAVTLVEGRGVLWYSYE